ncbi:hypothetical protein [Luteimonas saliphila]|uniref:hypothetical protein n=1 Tax=Luteimonas saliphila TaxID=2804919 RepID=UPI00192D8CBB|nr:hypothetical protein [Luteimonas saliphila]
MTEDPYSSSVDLTSDVGATVTVPFYASDSIHLSAGGDLSVSIGYISPANARALAKALNDAADIADMTQALVPLDAAGSAEGRSRG